MTIKELCEKYNCNITSMYGKLKRKKTELNGHIIMATAIADKISDAINNGEPDNAEQSKGQER